MVGIEFATLLAFIGDVIDLGQVLKRKFTEGREYRRRRFGSIRGELYHWLGLLNTEEIQRIHFNINLWSNDEACAWRDAYASRCSAICVASAIFASIGQSALSLQGLTEAHWIAGALLIASQVLGILSVVAGVSLQNSVTSLTGHKDVRLWLSKGISTHWYDYPESYQSMLLDCSAATVKLLEAPQILLEGAVIAYLLGFGLYLLYVWQWEVAEPVVNYRNSLIFYVCVIGAVVLFVSVIWGGRMMDKDKVNLHFNLKRRFDTGEVDKKMNMLDRWTEIVHVLTTSKSETERAEARKAMDDVLYFMRFGEKPSEEMKKEEEAQEKQRQDSVDTVVKDILATQP